MKYLPYSTLKPQTNRKLKHKAGCQLNVTYRTTQCGNICG